MKLSDICQANAHFAAQQHSGLVCVFAGATSGIGAATLEKLATLLHAPTFYVIGRSEIRFSDQRSRLEQLSPECNIFFLEAELSLLAHVDHVARKILAAERKVDILCMSPGLIPLNGPECMH